MEHSEKPYISDIERLARKFKISETGCWVWQGCTAGAGYGQTTFRQKKILLHRFFYQVVKGSIPKGLQIDHLCRVRACVNPKHLEAVTPGENIRRGNTGLVTGARYRARTHCNRGHELSGNNLHLTPSDECLSGFRRVCKQCERDAGKRYRERIKNERQLVSL